MIKVCAIQMSMSEDKNENVKKASILVEKAGENGANIVLLPELFQTQYFCKDKNDKYFDLAKTQKESELLKHFCKLAQKLKIVILVSYFERFKDDYFNSLVVIDADGKQMDNYRKTHIPNGVGYEETYYFKQGNSGYKVYKTMFAKIGVGICWDQWFCEPARELSLRGAEILFYPTAIGSEPETNIDSKEHWQRVQMGHSASNTVPIVVANRYGEEKGESCILNFYGSSFITDCKGEIISEASRNKEEIIYAEIDLEKNAEFRDYWGILWD